MQKILIVEDEENISSSLKLILESEGFFASVSATGADGLQNYPDSDLVILDLMLPDMNGMDILKTIRSKSSTHPVLIVSAKAEEEHLIEGLEAGADDYITKPFSLNELLLRIKRTLARKDLYKESMVKLKSNDTFAFSGGEIDFENLKATTKDGEISLTGQEANILLYIVHREGKVVSRKDLLEHVWGHNPEIETRTIDNFIVRFRKYFEDDPKKPKHFITKRGVGYIFNS